MLFGKVSIHRVHSFDIGELDVRHEAGIDCLSSITVIEVRIRALRSGSRVETFEKGSDAVVRC